MSDLSQVQQYLRITAGSFGVLSIGAKMSLVAIILLREFFNLQSLLPAILQKAVAKLSGNILMKELGGDVGSGRKLSKPLSRKRQ
jgi:hypothetical protein